MILPLATSKMAPKGSPVIHTPWYLHHWVVPSHSDSRLGLCDQQSQKWQYMPLKIVKGRYLPPWSLSLTLREAGHLENTKAAAWRGPYAEDLRHLVDLSHLWGSHRGSTSSSPSQAFRWLSSQSKSDCNYKRALSEN